MKSFDRENHGKNVFEKDTLANGRPKSSWRI